MAKSTMSQDTNRKHPGAGAPKWFPEVSREPINILDKRRHFLSALYEIHQGTLGVHLSCILILVQAMMLMVSEVLKEDFWNGAYEIYEMVVVVAVIFYATN